MVNPVQFIQQVRAEVAKVVWPNRREVALTSVMVFFLAVLTAAFFWVVDRIIFSCQEIVLTYFGT